MLFKEDVYMWFKHSEPHRRVEFVCGILNMCLPLELKFIRTFVENLSKRDDMLKDPETKCNKLSEVKQLGTVLDERTRSKLILCLALLEANNQTCSKLLYDCLILALSNHKNDEYLANISLLDKDSYNRQMQLIFTMMMHHPSFRYEEVKLASEKLNLLDHYEEKASDCWHSGVSSTKIGDDHSHHLNDLPIERNQVMEACDSGLSIGTEPEGEILSDHSCVPNQSEQAFSLPLCGMAKPDIEDKRKDILWQIPCQIPPGPGMSAAMPCKAGGALVEPTKLIAQHDLTIAPAQGAVNSSSVESLNIMGESAYIYNSSIYEKSAYEALPHGSVMPTKRETIANQSHQVIDDTKPSVAKPLWIGSVSNPSTSATYSHLQSSQVPLQKMATSIVTTSPQTSCHESSLSSGVIASVVVSRTTTRQAALPRQFSSSSSGNSHPSSPAMIGAKCTTRYAAPTSLRFTNERSICHQSHNAQSVSKDEFSSIISGPLSDSISFIPSVEDCNSISTSHQYMPPPSENNRLQGSLKHTAQSSSKNAETSLTITLTTTVANSSGNGCNSGQVTVAPSSALGNGNQAKHLHKNDLEITNSIAETKVSSRLSAASSNCPGGIVLAPTAGPLVPPSSAHFVAPAGSNRMPAYTFFPPNACPVPKPSFYYASKTNMPRPNGKVTSGRRRGRGDMGDVRHQNHAVDAKQLENSTSSSQYSSPSQTPSPDIKKIDKSENSGDFSEMCSGFSIGANSFTDNNSPPPMYSQYQVPPNHPRHRYMSFSQQPMGFIPYHHPPGTYRYPLTNHHLMMGSRLPPPSSTGDKSSREVTPPSVNASLETAIKPEISPTPSVSSSANLNRKSSSASPPGHMQDGTLPMAPPPNHIGHGPLPFNGPNYQMYPGPYFPHMPGFMPGHASLANGFVPQMPPNFSLPPMTELVYQTPYPIIGAAHQPSSVGVPAYQTVLPNKPKRSPTCYNCGHVGHMGSDCNESSMIELTNCT